MPGDEEPATGIDRRPSDAARSAGRERRLGLPAHISQTGRCIGFIDLRKSCCRYGLPQGQGKPDADGV